MDMRRCKRTVDKNESKLKCDKCGNEIGPEEKSYTAVGVVVCEKCNNEGGGCISLDLVLDKIIKSKEVNK